MDVVATSEFLVISLAMDSSQAPQPEVPLKLGPKTKQGFEGKGLSLEAAPEVLMTFYI